MAIFKYKAVNSDGKTVYGMMGGFSSEEIKAKLRKYDLSPLNVEDKTGSLELKLLQAINRVTAKDLVIFSRQFSVMVSANVSVGESLKVLVDQTENITLKAIISEISYDVAAGSRLSDVLEEHDNVFSNFYINMVRSGESSGKLDEVLTYLADEMEKDYDMSSKVKGALIYPAFITVGIVVVGFIMMTVVIPKMIDILAETGGEMPTSTRIVMATSSFLVSYWWLVVVVVIGLGYLFRMFIKTEFGRFKFDYFKLKIPIIGSIFQKIYLVRFTRALRTLVMGGLPIVKSLGIVSKVVGNVVYKELIEEAADAISGGDSMSAVFSKSTEIPKMVPQMIGIGEKTGNLDLVLDKITNFYSKEVENILNNLTAIIEPLIMVIMGLGVGVMVAAILLPMYNLSSQF